MHENLNHKTFSFHNALHCKSFIWLNAKKLIKCMSSSKFWKLSEVNVVIAFKNWKVSEKIGIYIIISIIDNPNSLDLHELIHYYIISTFFKLLHVSLFTYVTSTSFHRTDCLTIFKIFTYNTFIVKVLKLSIEANHTYVKSTRFRLLLSNHAFPISSPSSFSMLHLRRLHTSHRIRRLLVASGGSQGFPVQRGWSQVPQRQIRAQAEAYLGHQSDVQWSGSHRGQWWQEARWGWCQI